jgi:phosphomannomutase
LNIANGFKHKDENGNLLKNTNETIVAHEFGHAWGIQKDKIYARIKEVRQEYMEWVSGIGSSRGTKEEVIADSNNSTSVLVENLARERLGLPRKLSHQPK